MASNEPIIQFKNFSFKYPGEGTRDVALQNINLEIKRGEFVAIMGPNGAGKSTLCLAMNGVIPTVISGKVAGEVKIADLGTYEHSVYEISTRVGLVLQDPETQLLCPNLKAELCFGPENLGVPVPEILERVDWALDVVRLPKMYNREPTQLSGGQKQRAGIAAVLTMRPEILVLDEPTSQLDPIGTMELFDVIKDLNKKYHQTIIVSSHQSEEVARDADRVVFLLDGKIIADGTPREVFAKKELIEKMSLAPPQVTEAGYIFKKANAKFPIPVTIQEGIQNIGKFLRELNPKKAITEANNLPRWSPPSRDPILESRDLTHIYPGGVHALDAVNIKIWDGDFVAIIGQNGAGKTTLVKHFIGLLKPTMGSVFVEGQDTTTLTTGEIAKKVGFVLQNPDHQIFAQSVKEEVAFGPTNLGLSPEEVESRTLESLKVVGLDDRLETYPFRLSYGDRRKLSVASILSMHPKILIYDEPTTGQDYQGRYQIVEIARRLNEEGHTCVMITHDMNLVARYAPRTIVLGLGKVLLDGPTADVFTQVEELAKTYIQPPQITQLAQGLQDLGIPPNILTVEAWAQLIHERFGLEV